MRRATKAELRQEIAELRHVGAQMANVCFGLAKHGSIEASVKLLSTLFRQWDSIRRREELR